MAMRQDEGTAPVSEQVDQTPARRGKAGGLLQRTFLIALVLVSGGLITSSAVELFFRYRENVEAIWSLPREVARGAAFEIQQFVRDIEHTLRAATQTPDIVAAGLTKAYRFQLDKLLKSHPPSSRLWRWTPQGAHGGLLYEYNGATQTFHLRATHGTEQEFVDTLQAAPIRLGEGAVGSAAARLSPVAVPDCLDEQAVVLPRVRSLMIQLGYRSLLAVPLLLDKQTFGGLVVYRSEPGPFPAQSVQLLQTFATQSVLALQNARHFQEIAEWNRTLEQRVSEQLTALEGMDRMKRCPSKLGLGLPAPLPASV
jgi:GAF domain-containing protein